MENIVVKGEIAHFERFRLFQQCFPKVISFDMLNEERVELLVFQSLSLFQTKCLQYKSFKNTVGKKRNCS